jgi:PAS domain S-box-containing protein
LALSNINMAVFQQDRTLRYTWIYQPQLGYLPEQVVGQTDAELLPPDDARRVTELKQRVLETGETARDEVSVTVKGATFSYDLAVEPLREASGAIIGLTGVSLDITQRKSADAKLRASEAKFRGLIEQSLVGIYLVDGEKVLYQNPRADEIFGYQPGELVGAAMKTLVVDEDWPVAEREIRRLVSGEISVIRLDFRGRRKDGQEVIVGAQGTLTHIDGKPILIGVLQDVTDKKRAEEQNQRYVVQLEKALMNTVEVVTTISELRDPYTAGHEHRVAEIAVAIGAELGLDARGQEGLRVAGHLHDVGKITIPSEILSKPGKLNANEFALVKGHPQAGYDILKNVEFPWPVAQVAYQHHERIDGSGYPQGLKGEEILFEARIMTVADVVEAMASHRPYRPGLGIDKALAEIERGRGTAYDPVVADACLCLFRQKGFGIPD